MHPTAKPVALVADAIRGCSHRGGLILHLFGGSGTTPIAAKTCGRTARLSHVVAKRLHDGLPKRMRMAGTEREHRVDFRSRHSKRVLLKGAYRGRFALVSDEGEAPSAVTANLAVERTC